MFDRNSGRTFPYRVTQAYLIAMDRLYTIRDDLDQKSVAPGQIFCTP
jgi:hypothetical protein